MWKRHFGKEGAARHVLAISLFIVGVAAVPASAGTITVGWDLMVDPQVTGYRVYVGTATQNYTQTFDVPADKDFFIFRNAFMGVRYYFAVAAQFDNARYGPRSYEVTAVGTRTVSASLPDGARVGDPALTSCGVDCFAVTEVARGLGEVSSLTVSNDGSLFAIEDGRRVLVLRGGAATVAFEAEPGTTLRDIALDSQFDATGRVFLSLLRPLDARQGDVEILRLRYLAGTLAEPATIMSGPAVPLAARAALAVGNDALVYLALPSLLGRSPYSSSVVAVDQDGRLPAGQQTPVFGRGVDDPIDLAWDGQARGVWLVGRNGASGVAPLLVSRSAESRAADNFVGRGETASGVAVSPAGASRLLVGVGLDLVEGAPGTPDTVRISLDGQGTPVAVAVGGGARYAALRSETAAAGFRIVRVEDGNLRAAP